MSNNFDNINAAGLTDQGTFTPDALFDRDTLTQIITLKSGSGVHVRGELLGQITKGAASSAVKASGANTGNGTLVLDATTPVLAKADVGISSLRFTSTTNVQLLGPNGQSFGNYVIGGSATNTITINDRFKFVLTQGSTPFAVGDGFDITVAAGSGQYVLAVSTAVDGSDQPSVILLEDNVDTTSGAVNAAAALRGKFATAGVTFGSGWTAASAASVLRLLGIFLQDIVG